MSTPRDTQFAGFAKLQWEDVANNIRRPRDFLLDAETLRREEEQIIARRAYDLVCHVAHELDRLRAFYYAYKDEVGSTPQQMIKGIPDLTAWPDAPTTPAVPDYDPMEIVTHACAVCGKAYHGPIGAMQGWYGTQRFKDGERTIYAFCMEAHMRQWLEAHPNEQE